MDWKSENIDQLAAALAEAQAELEPAQKNATNPMLRNKYADLASCYEAVKKVLPRHGMAVSQLIIPSERGMVHVKTILTHNSGQWLASDCVLEAIGNKGVNAAQAAGSAITYARRYGLSAIVGLVADDDDDGCNACPSPKERHEQDRARAKAANSNQPNSKLLAAFWAIMKKRHATASTREEFAEQVYADVGAFLGREITTASALTEAEIKEFLDAVNGVENA